MGKVAYTDFRRKLSGYMDRVCDSGVPLMVTLEDGRSIVVISEDEYQGMMETMHLLNNPQNARRLIDAVVALDAGQGIEHDLVE